MSPTDYEFFAGLLLKSSGLSLGPEKSYLLEARLVPLARSWGLSDLKALVGTLRAGAQKSLHDAVVEAMTTNETSFFRDKRPFDELREHVLPALIAARRLQKRLRIWSAAASTGQEAYSLAILLHDHFPELNDWRVEIVGTDLSESTLARARAAVYSQFDVQRGLPIQHLVKHFEQVPEGWRVKEPLRKNVRFEPLNLLDDFSRLGLFDIVLCRNVLIYFEPATKTQVLDRISRRLRPDGVLALGAAETVLGLTDAFTRAETGRSCLYRLTSAVTASCFPCG